MFNLLLLFLLIAGSDCAHGFCGTDKLFKNITMKTVSPIVTKKLTSSTRPFKIFMDYTSMNIEGLVSDQYISSLKKLLDEMVVFFEKLFMSVDDEIVLKFNTYNTYGCYHLPLEFSSAVINGVETDLVIVPVVSSRLPESAVAAAVPCSVLPTNNRPVFGIIHLGTNYDFSNAQALKYSKTVLAHEIVHIFGFVGKLFETFPNKPDITQKKINGVSKTLVATPKVLEIARKHFGCDSIEGIEIESQGGEGSAGSHWEARTMLGDFMISTVYPEFVLSDITLAFLEDSGWYKINYYTGGLFTFGKNQGCNFLNKPCYEKGGTKFPNDFCNPDKNQCFEGHRDKGQCALFTYAQDIQEEYRYFDDKGSNVGGFQPADFCPVVVSNMAQNGQYYFFNCQNGVLSADSSKRDEVISSTSMCIDSSLEKDPVIVKTRGTCYQVSCDFENLTFDIKIGSKIVTCGQNKTSEHTVEGYSGKLTCPKFGKVCTSKIRCTDMFDCVEKKATSSGVVVDGQTYHKVYFVGLFTLLLAMIF